MSNSTVALFSAGLLLGVRAAVGQCNAEGFWHAAAPMSAPADQTCSAVVDGNIYVFGGHNFALGAPNSQARMYNPRSNTWTALPDMPTGRGMSSCAAVGGVIYVIGGNNCSSNCWLNTVEALDTATMTWTTKATVPPLAAIGFFSGHRGLHAAVSVGAKIYLFGGANSYIRPSAFGGVQIYDTVADSWTEGPAMPRPRCHHGAVLWDNKVYMVGGFKDSPNWPSQYLVGETDVLDLATSTWSSVASMPTPRMDCSVIESGGKIYAIGGSDLNGVSTAAVDAFDPIFNCWQSVTPLPMPLSWGTAQAVSRRIYMFGGDSAQDSDLRAECFVGVPLPCRFDLNGDGYVDAMDYDTFVGGFLAGGCAP